MGQAKLKKAVVDIEHQKRAEAALKIAAKVQELSKVLEEDKEYFRDEANDEGLTIDVPGIGSVQVRKPSLGSRKLVTSFDEDAFNALSDAMKEKLRKAGIIKRTLVTTQPSKAGVVFTLNK